MFKKYEPSSYQSPQTNLNNTPGKQQHKNINELTRSYHHRRPSIQKQMSVDHDIAARRKNLHYTSGGSGCVANSGISVNKSFRSLHQRSTSSLQIYSAMKQVPHINTPTDLRPKSDERFNISIFLSHNLSSTNSENNELDGIKEQNVTTPHTKNSITNQQNVEKKSAENKRALYRASRNNAISFGARPKLVRAMSAPLRSMDTENSNNPWPTKRRNRTKRNGQDSVRLVMDHHQRESHLYLETDEQVFCKDDIKSQNLKARNKLLQVKPIREVGSCDIVTLVSLLSPGASDSEKEECTQGKNEFTTSSPSPPLRRIEKSVSFQENNKLSTDLVQRELPTMLRRASIAPLAAKIRSNRPPTAPPGSIYLRNCDLSDTNRNTENIIIPSGKLINPKLPKFNTMQSTDETHTFPEYVRTVKEKECWILYKKIADKGIHVSYETVMRGMLTPSEVRASETKQKDFNERQASIDAENAEETTPNSKK